MANIEDTIKVQKLFFYHTVTTPILTNKIQAAKAFLQKSEDGEPSTYDHMVNVIKNILNQARFMINRLSDTNFKECQYDSTGIGARELGGSKS